MPGLPARPGGPPLAPHACRLDCPRLAPPSPLTTPLESGKHARSSSAESVLIAARRCTASSAASRGLAPREPRGEAASVSRVQTSRTALRPRPHWPSAGRLPCPCCTVLLAALGPAAGGGATCPLTVSQWLPWSLATLPPHLQIETSGPELGTDKSQEFKRLNRFMITTRLA